MRGKSSAAMDDARMQRPCCPTGAGVLAAVAAGGAPAARATSASARAARACAGLGEVTLRLGGVGSVTSDTRCSVYMGVGHSYILHSRAFETLSSVYIICYRGV